MTEARLDELLKSVRARAPYSANTEELPDWTRAAIIAVLLPAIQEEGRT